jgi:dipeptidyl aminopeptidase/acylaminoacyl peptidase
MKSRFLFALLLASGLYRIANVQAIEPRELLEVADFSSPVLSQDGRKVAFRVERASVERNTYDAVWYVQDVNGTSLPRRVADGGTVLRDTAGVSLPAPAQWSPDGHWIYYRALVDGKLAVWRASTDGAGASPVTHDPADVREFVLADNGRTLEYSVGPTRNAVLEAEQAEYDHGIHIDGTVPVGQPLFRSGNIEGRLATQRYGKTGFSRVPLLADVPGRWKAMDLATGVQRELSSSGAGHRQDAEGELPDVEGGSWKQVRSAEGWVAMLTRVGERKNLRLKPNVALSVRSPNAHRPVLCAASLCTRKEITGIQWRPAHNEVLFTVAGPEEGGAQSIYRWNVETNAVYPVVYSRGLVNGGRPESSQCGISPEVMVCVTADANQPPRLERVDLETGARQVLFAPNAALAQEVARSSPARLLRWKDAEGHVFTGQFYAAHGSGGAAAPLFVNYYLCTGFVRGGVGDEYPFASLAAHGISALCINHPLGYLMDATARYEQGVAAVESAIDLLSKEGRIDRTRVGMGGLSFGSEVTTWIAMKLRLLAAASVSTPSMSSTYYLLGSIRGKLFTDALRMLWGLRSPEETPDRWHLLSPQFNLDKISAPILLQMPEQEYLAALDYAIPLIDRRMADLYVFPNEPHQKFQPRHKLAVYERNIDWFRFWLQGYEDPDPVKRAQYTHWREMRNVLSAQLPNHAGEAGRQSQ